MNDATYYDDYTVGDMALDLAEHEAAAMPVGELISIAEVAIDERWLDTAEREPEKVRQLWKTLVGEA